MHGIFGIFKMVLAMSLMGGCITILLLIIKPITAKKLPAGWQRFAWLIAIAAMLVPVWKLIPDGYVQQPSYENYSAAEAQPPEDKGGAGVDIIESVPMEYREIHIIGSGSIRLYDALALIWLFGACVFLCIAFGSYFVFLAGKRRHSFRLEHSTVFEGVKAELDIRRNIRVRISADTVSPMLVGTLFPTIYVPQKSMDEAAERMVFRHELTHYKHGDLLLKWLSLFMNAVHWFNPFAYLLAANISEACEVSCDMAVIKNLNEDDRQLYMETILNLLEK